LNDVRTFFTIELRSFPPIQAIQAIQGAFMHVGIPTETKNNEFRVAITPSGVAELTRRGHEVLIQAGAGEGSAIADSDFKAAGAQLIATADEVWAEADLVLKVKEPTPMEYARMRRGQTLFTYLHLAASRACTEALLDSATTSIAYETVQTADGALPLLAPMSEVAGRLSAQVGAYHLMRTHGGRGVLMGGVPGVEPANVVVIGGGTAGYNAARVAGGMGAAVTVLDVNINKLGELDTVFGGRVQTRYSTALELEQAIKHADLVIGAVLLPGARAPKLVSNSLVAHMKPGAVLVDIAIDQGGCFEGSHPTTHDDPTFAVLLRGEHAGCGAENVDVRVDQRHDALCDRTRRPRLESGLPVEPRTRQRTFDARRSAAVPAGGR
jgi:alanine dehydrogenase